MTKLALALAGAASLLAASADAQVAATPPAPPAPPAPGPSLALAVEAAQTAISVCTANGYKVSVAVVDSAGVLKVLLSGDGASARSTLVAQRKTATTMAYKMSSAAVVEAAKTDPAIAARLENDPALFNRAGAQPLMSKGALFGAIGVSGAPGGEKDDVCGLAGIAKIKDRL
jgi:uncharacterized protein GlcG (DUF336 family)